VGEWIASLPKKGAKPLGLHLEGPFLNPEAAGVHPAQEMRRASIPTLEEWWKASHETIRLMTVAPEIHSPEELKALCSWAKKRKVRLSIGHSHASYAQATRAFDLGFSGVTHAWNAGQFHHREPGVLGAALGRKDVYIMVIVDGVHVHPAAVEWILRAHPQMIFVSDCAPSAGLKDGEESDFGPIRVRQVRGEARVVQPHVQAGPIGGSGVLLPSAVRTFKKASQFARAQAPSRWRAWSGGHALKWLSGQE
jgi:N-acetylglucosamine-6-phosphate deacetylase